MKKYLLGLLALPIMSPLLSLASAADYTFTSSDGSHYTPNSVTFTNSFTATSSSVSSYVIGNYEYPHITFYDSSENPVCNFYLSDGLIYAGESGQTCEFEAGETYSIGNTDEECYASITISDGVSSGGGDSDSVFPELSVPASFTSGITQLVNNFGSTISEWIPVVILVTLGITAVFALFRVVRNYARRSFKG